MIIRWSAVVLVISSFSLRGIATYSFEKNDLQLMEANQNDAQVNRTYYYSELTIRGNCRHISKHEDDMFEEYEAFSRRQIAASFLNKLGIIECNPQFVKTSCKKNFVITFYTSKPNLNMYSLYSCPDESFCEMKFKRSKFKVIKFYSEIPQIFEYKPSRGLSRRNIYLVLIASSALGLVVALIVGIFALYCGWFSYQKPKYIYTLGIAAYNETPRIFSNKSHTIDSSTLNKLNKEEQNFLDILHQNGDYDSVNETQTNDSFSSDDEYEISQEIFNLPHTSESNTDLRINPENRFKSDSCRDCRHIPVSVTDHQSTSSTDKDGLPLPVTKSEETGKSKLGLTNIRFINDDSPGFRIETDL